MIIKKSSRVFLVQVAFLKYQQFIETLGFYSKPLSSNMILSQKLEEGLAIANYFDYENGARGES